MEGHSLISADILASYAADAALEIDGVSRLVEGTRPRHHGVKITTTDGVCPSWLLNAMCPPRGAQAG